MLLAEMHDGVGRWGGGFVDGKDGERTACVIS